MAELKRDDILKVNDLKYKLLEVPEWGGSVRVYTLTIAQKLRIESEFFLESGGIDYKNTDFQYAITSMCVKDKEGVAIFGPEDKELFQVRAHSAITRIVLSVVKYNWDPTLVEDLEKN